MSKGQPITGLVKVEGLAELEKKLQEFGPDLAKKGVRYAVSRGAAVIRKEARDRAPKRTGNLKRAIFIKFSRDTSSPWIVNYIVGARRGQKLRKVGKSAFYWSFIEFGTKFIDERRYIRDAFRFRRADAAEKIKEALAKKVMEYAEKRG